MKRRSFLAGLGAAAASPALPMPALAQSERSRVLRFSPASGLTVLDPMTTSITSSHNHGHYVFDQLYAVDSKYVARPQMAAGHTVSSDQLTWDIKLRPGLKFHDGEKVLAKDCVASIKRWWAFDSFGGTLRRYTDEVLAVDDDTLRFRLKKPFGILPDALGHPVASPLMIMPERIANPDPKKPLTEMIGSGPMKWVAGDFVQGQTAAYARNTAYIPRDEKSDFCAGGKVVNFERIEWKAILDPSTAAAALQTGEIDWWDVVYFDLIDTLKANKNVKLEVADPGYLLLLRFNSGIGAFSNPALRRVVAKAVNQLEIMSALVGPSPDLGRECYAMFSCSVAGIEQPGTSLMSSSKKDYKQLADEVKKAGYNGEKIVLFRVVDNVLTSPVTPVVADVLKEIGFNVEIQSLEQVTYNVRRQSQAAVSEGGWSIYLSQGSTPVTANPVVDPFIRGDGFYPGKYVDPELEAMIAEWIGISDLGARSAQTTKIQKRLFDMMPIVPLGGFSTVTGMRADLTGFMGGGASVPWGLRRV